jgi:hypothetical protein
MSQKDKPRKDVAANTLELRRDGASLLAKFFRSLLIDWLDRFA